MKKRSLLVLVCVLGITVPFAASAATQKAQTPASTKAQTPPPAPPEENKPSELWFGMNANLSLVHINLSTRKYLVGFTPGLAFGIQWKPQWWSISPSFLGLDALISATFVNLDASDDLDYFQISAIPVFTIAGMVSAGLGVSYNLAIKAEAKDTLEFIFSFGLSTPVSFQNTEPPQ